MKLNTKPLLGNIINIGSLPIPSPLVFSPINVAIPVLLANTAKASADENTLSSTSKYIFPLKFIDELAF
ncbi:hypothetical protein UT300003_22700 [Clostridium sardiniense]